MVEIDTPLVRQLIASQFPVWAHHPIERVEPNGWDNRTFRLGSEMSVRLPSHERNAAQVEKEQEWLPKLGPLLPLPVPTGVRLMHEPAKEPNDLERFFVQRANAGDVDGLVALYESDATLANGEGGVVVGTGPIRQFFIDFLASRPHLAPSLQAPALRSGDIALTSSRLGNGDVTAEIARRQPDGNWLWAVDQFALVKGE